MVKKLAVGLVLTLLYTSAWGQSCEEARANDLKVMKDECAALNLCEGIEPAITCYTCALETNSFAYANGLSGFYVFSRTTVTSNGQTQHGYGLRGTSLNCNTSDSSSSNASKSSNAVEDPVCVKGSIVQVENQALSEKLPIIGTGFDLYYHSAYAKGRAGDFSLSVAISGATPRDYIQSFDVKTYRGSTLIESVNYANTTPNQSYSYTWNGLNSSNQESLGPEVFKVVVTENSPTGSFDFPQNITLGHFNAKLLGLGGWLPGNIHFYDSNSKTLYRGNGTSRSVEGLTWNTTGFYVSEEDASLVYYFDSTGRQVLTKSGLTGTTLYTFNYDSQGQLSSINEPFSRSTVFNRNLSGDFVSITAPKGQITNVTLDANGYLASLTNPNSETYSMTYYGAGGLLATFTKPGTQVSTFTYDADGNLTKDEHSGGYFFEIIKNIAEVNYQKTTSMGRTTTYKNSKSIESFVSDVQMPSGMTESYSRVRNTSNTESVTNGDGTSTAEYAADARFGKMAQFQVYGSRQRGSISYTFFNTQNITLNDPNDPFSIATYSTNSQKDNLNITTTYNPSTKVFTTTTGVGRSSQTTIDTYERVTSLKQGNLYSTDLTYTNENLTKIKQNTRETNLTYNATTGFLSSVTNPLSQVTGFTYDNAGRVTAKTLPDLRVIGYSYDANGNLVGITPPSRPVHSFGINASELPSSYAPPTLSGVSVVNTTYSYNDDKQLTQILKPTGNAIDFSYNATTGVLESLTASAGVYTYSMNTSNGLPSSIVSPNSGPITNISYAGTLPTQFTTYTSGWTQISDYTANLSSNGTVGSDVVAGASATSTINYTYDNDEVLKTAGDIVLTYNTPNGLLTGLTMGTGSTTGFTDTYTYNSYGEVETYTAKRGSTTLYTLNLGRDALGRINSKTEFMNAVTNAYAYTFDSTGRLTQTDKNAATVATYGYDSNSNRNSGTIGSQATTASYNDQDWMTAYNTLTFAYNANGDLQSRTNTTTSTTTQYVYDVFGNLTQVTLPSGTVISYEIDGLNRRIGKKVNGVLQKRWVYMDQSRIAAELNASGGIAKRFIYGSKANVPDYMIVGTTKYRIISDHLGSVRLVVKQSDGTVAQRMNHDEFGRVTEDTNPGYLPFGFAGGLYDHQTGLVRFGARDYDAETGRWTTKDPILFNGGDANLYGYVMSDPVNFIDPLGLWSISIGGYLGIGGSVTVGQNPNGSYFGSFRGGVGIGGGFSWDKHGSSPDGGTCGSVSIGQYAEGSAHFGPLETVIGTSSGYSQSNGPYYNPPSFFGSVVPSIGVGAGVSGGFEVIFH